MRRQAYRRGQLRAAPYADGWPRFLEAASSRAVRTTIIRSAEASFASDLRQPLVVAAGLAPEQPATVQSWVC